MAFKNALALKPDLWLTYHTYYKSPDIFGPSICRLLNIPYVLFQPMYATKWRKKSGSRVGFYLNRIALKAARHAFANNLEDLGALRRVIPSERITYLPPGIFPEEFARDEFARERIRAAYGIPDDMPLIMSAARLRDDVKFRSMTYLIHSLALLNAEEDRFMLLIAGDGPMEDELKRLGRKLLPGQTLFCGGVKREKMVDYYSAADLFVFPGIGESLGMVFLEAQASGLPVVALKSPATLQVIRNDATGFLVADDGGRSMAKAVSRLLHDSDLRGRLGANGRELIWKERNLHKNYLRLSSILERLKV